MSTAKLNEEMERNAPLDKVIKHFYIDTDNISNFKNITHPSACEMLK